MELIKQSCFYYLLRRLRAFWDESVAGAIWRRFSAWFAALVERSGVYSLLTREGGWSRRWGESLFYHGADTLLNAIPRGLSRLKKKPAGEKTPSLLLYVLDTLGEKRYLLPGILLMLMLCVPYEVWNNLFGAAGACLIFLLYYFWAIPRKGAGLIPVRELGPFYLIFLLNVLAGFFFSRHMGLSLRFVIFHLTCAMLVFTVAGSVETAEELRKMLRFVMVGLLISSLFGCWQLVTGVEYYSYQLDAALNSGIKMRIYSFFSNPNNYCTFIVMLLPFAFALFTRAASTRERGFCLLVILLTLVSCAATYSRSGWLGLIVALLVYAALTDWRYIALLAVLGILALPLLPKTILTRLMTIGNMSDSSSKYRVQIYKSFARLLETCWRTGVGLGTDNTYKVLHDFPPMGDGNWALHSHNNYMQLCAEIGLIGTFSYTAAILGRVKRMHEAAARAKDKTLRPIVAAAAGGMVGVAFMGLVDYTWYYPRSMFVFWFLFGVMAACSRLARREETGSVKK